MVNLKWAEYKLTMWPPSMIACACVAASVRAEAQRNDPSTATSVTDDVLGQLQRITLIENVTVNLLHLQPHLSHSLELF